MSFDVNLSITGIEEAQNEMAKAIARLQATGPRQQAIKDATTAAHRYLVSITHVDTGTYRASQWMEILGPVGLIYVNPSTVNPRSGQRPVEYSIYEEERGGTHAAYRRTVDEAGPRIIKEASEILARGMLYG